MTRSGCEKKLLALAREMQAVYSQYNPAGGMLSATMEGGYINIGDSYVTDQCKVILDANDMVFQTVDVVQFKDGQIRHGRQWSYGQVGG